MRKLIRTCILAGLVALPVMQAHASMAMSDTVTISFDDAANELFGEATVLSSGNTTTITFFPADFVAQSTNGAGVESIFDILNFTIGAKDGYAITNLSLSETGDYELSSDFGASGDAPQVNTRGLWAVTSNTMIDTAGVGDLPAGFNFRSEALFSTGTLTGDTGGSGANWNIDANVDLDSLAGWGMDTSVTATLENHISAWSFDNGELANIAKKSISISVTTVSAVPVPASVWLFGSGLMGLVTIARRKQLS